MTVKFPKNTRRDPSVLEAAAVGAVACDGCGGVHIDFLDADDALVATGFLTFDAFRLMVQTVGNEMERLGQ